MKRVFRTDAGSLSTIKRISSGGVIVEARLSRTGVQSYRQPDGSILKEFRPESEVFRQETLDSMRGAPVTLKHPGRVRPHNVKELKIGTLLEGRKAPEKIDGRSWTMGPVLIDDPAQIPRVGVDLKECSLAYDCDYDETPGVDPDTGESYDVVQRNMIINALGLGDQGFARAGRPAKLLLDGNEEISDSEETEMATEIQLPKTMVVCDGINVEQGSPTHISVLELKVKKETDRADGLQKELDTAKVKLADETKRADTAEGLKKAAEDKLKADGGADKLEAAVQKELEFRSKVAPILGKEFEFTTKRSDGVVEAKSHKDLLLAAVSKLNPQHSFKADSSEIALEAYLEGMTAGKTDYSSIIREDGSSNSGDANPYAAATAKASGVK